MSLGRLLPVLAMTMASSSTWAQSEPASTSLPLDRFRTPIDDKGLGVTEGGAVPGHLAFQGGLVLNYALNPLVLRDQDNNVVAALVAHRVGVDLLFTIGLFEYISLGVELPLTAQQGGAIPEALRSVIAEDKSAGLGIGDLRLVPKVRLLREDVHFVSLALMPMITLPTSGGLAFDDNESPAFRWGANYLGEGDGVFAFIPEVAASTNFVGVRVAANLGYRLRQPTLFLGAFPVEPELVYRLGVGYDLGEFIKEIEALLLSIEIFGATSDSNPFGLVDPAADPDAVRLQNPLEFLISGRWRVGGGVLVEGGLGGGLRAGFGSPDLRLYAGVRYGVEDNDKDDDGVDDKSDACAAEAEDKDGHDDSDGCPDRDDDGDGFPDGADRCPDAAEDTDAFADEDGCPDDDNDNDGVNDVDDRCRDSPGLLAFGGCPTPDSDGDGLTDDVDACADVAGGSELTGCPADEKGAAAVGQQP